MQIADALSRGPVPRSDAGRDELVRLLDHDPLTAARNLWERGEWRAVPDLQRAFARLAEAPLDDCPVCACEHLHAIAIAIRRLGGTLSEPLRAKWELLMEARDAAWISFDDLLDEMHRAAPATRAARPGRNARCPCGSGKKYKKCCADRDRGHGTH